MKQILLILLISILVDNFCMSKFLGICPFLGVSRKVETAIGMGMAVTFVMVLASIITWLVQLLLVALKIEFAQTIAFILVIAALVQFVEMVIQKSSPTLYQSLGVYLPLITTNCAVLGVAILNIQNKYNLIETIFNGLGGALGFTLAIVLFAGIRERLELSDIPKSFEGFPIALVSASLMAISFLGFSGLGK
ncbi:electron transport complex, RnfABCDGE type, A subunit [Peptostreptococcaceae bacterium AS15]|jgi:electron transport complex, rnfABCDGE type, A subunit|nr:electron transport complex, RnfABCDGE type, A subunit [[Eubacterium] yurii subsp. margaretiae ATCC 43715]EJP26241.1 electron transport complex, RnfABCDGE type, A subunit [Peptostreptococcaceae bacterium AS15]RKW49155.1 MAG: electron transport complex subunit RsxA [Lachnospiraceae bacterium]SKC62487.1 electron transport complex protein RnfA [[Eubacterium] yurii]